MRKILIALIASMMLIGGTAAQEYALSEQADSPYSSTAADEENQYIVSPGFENMDSVSVTFYKNGEYVEPGFSLMELSVEETSNGDFYIDLYHGGMLTDLEFDQIELKPENGGDASKIEEATHYYNTDVSDSPTISDFNDSQKYTDFTVRGSILWSLSDQTVKENQTFTSEAFAAERVEEMNLDIALDENESLEATVTGYNQTAETGNQTFEHLEDGENTEVLHNSNFGDSTTTYVAEFTAENGTVSIIDAEITGTSSNEETSGAAPVATGSFFDRVPVIGDVLAKVWNTVLGIFDALTAWIGGLTTS